MVLVCYKVCAVVAHHRYSIVFIFFGFLFGLHLPLLLVCLILPFFLEQKGHERPWKTRIEYIWLIVFALLVLAHSVLAGVICEFKEMMLRLLFGWCVSTSQVFSLSLLLVSVFSVLPLPFSPSFSVIFFFLTLLTFLLCLSFRLCI